MRVSNNNRGKLLLIASMFSSSLAASLDVSSSGAATSLGNCYDYEIPLTTQTENKVWAIPRFTNSYDVVGFFANLAKRTPFKFFASEPRNATGEYTISATFCSPKTFNGHENTILLATPGLGYDKRYWASGIDPAKYSFLEYSIARGYSVFLYDRLGTGKSTKVSGYTDAQGVVQTAILKSLTDEIRESHYTGNITASKIVHVGHSFGSVLTQSLVSEYPSLSDGIILTGQVTNETDFPGFFEAARLDIANDVAPGKWPGRDSGYLAYADVFGAVGGFSHVGNFDKEILWYTQYIAQPPAVMESITGQPTALESTEYTGPVLILNGEFDFGNCAGDCNDILAYPNAAHFDNSRSFETAVHPGAGHGINFNLNATGAYGVMLDFITNNGL